MRDRDRQDAIRRNILDLCESLEKDVLEIDGISSCDFDIRNFPEIPQVILVLEYDIDVNREDYFDARSKQVDSVIEVCKKHDLYYSGDRIEDMGKHWYFVRSCGKAWRERIQP